MVVGVESLAMSKQQPNSDLWVKVRAAYEQGYADVEIMKLMGTTKEKFYELMSNDPKFREFIEMGRVLSEAWWMEQGRNNLKAKQGERFDTALYTFITKNRFGWAEKIQNSISGEAPLEGMSNDELLTKINQYMNEHAKKFGSNPSMAEMLKATKN